MLADEMPSRLGLGIVVPLAATYSSEEVQRAQQAHFNNQKQSS